MLAWRPLLVSELLEFLASIGGAVGPDCGGSGGNVSCGCGNGGSCCCPPTLPGFGGGGAPGPAWSTKPFVSLAAFPGGPNLEACLEMQLDFQNSVALGVVEVETELAVVVVQKMVAGWNFFLALVLVDLVDWSQELVLVLELVGRMHFDRSEEMLEHFDHSEAILEVEVLLVLVDQIAVLRLVIQIDQTGIH